jgi:putative peptidoglycan lipid II flippase
MFKRTLRLYVWAIGLFGIVFALGLMLFAQPIVQILFQRGRFPPEATQQVVWLVVGLAIGLPASAILNITGRALTALQKTRALILTTTIFLICNTLLDVGFAPIWGGFGIALASSLAYTVKMLLFFALLRMEIGPLHLFKIAPELWSLTSMAAPVTYLLPRCSRPTSRF